LHKSCTLYGFLQIVCVESQLRGGVNLFLGVGAALNKEGKNVCDTLFDNTGIASVVQGSGVAGQQRIGGKTDANETATYKCQFFLLHKCPS
jgi:hypothetical protein